MPTATLKCCQCKERFPRDKAIKSLAGNLCSESCLMDKIAGKKREKADKEHKLRKKVFYASDIKTRKAAAKKACHDYVRARDYGKPCICCGRPLGSKYDAGHFLESGNNPRIRYDEDNIHGQSVYCNQYQGGNSDNYRGRLIEKIGRERVERLESMKGGTVKRTAEDYKEIEKYYKDKLKQLNGG